jgi:hypothetical protein
MNVFRQAHAPWRIAAATVFYSDHTLRRCASEVTATIGAESLEFRFTDRSQNRAVRDHQFPDESEPRA